MFQDRLLLNDVARPMIGLVRQQARSVVHFEGVSRMASHVLADRPADALRGRGEPGHHLADAASGACGSLAVRKVVLYREQVLQENGCAPARAALRGWAAAVIANPWLGTGPSRDLSAEVAAIAPRLAALLTARLIDALGGAGAVEAFGKGAIVGSAGEIEHASALIHTPYFGNLLRELLDGESIICFADARGEAGQSLIVPMWNKTHAASRSHYQSIVASVADAPRAGEIVVIAAASTGTRPHPRIGDRSTDPAVTAEILENLPS